MKILATPLSTTNFPDFFESVQSALEHFELATLMSAHAESSILIEVDESQADEGIDLFEAVHSAIEHFEINSSLVQLN